MTNSSKLQQARFQCKILTIVFVLQSLFALTVAHSADLAEIQERGVLRHLGVPYANFVTGAGDGMEVEVIQSFAKYLSVEYEFVQSTWQTIFGDLTGTNYRLEGGITYVPTEPTPVKGDIIATGLAVLPLRKEIVEFSEPTFPSAVWLVAVADSPLQPVEPGESELDDIQQVRLQMKDKTVFAIPTSCLDPVMHDIYSTGAKVIISDENPAFLVPAILNREAEATLLDMPESLVALSKWYGQIKVIGPVSPMLEMACAFPKNSPELRKEFNTFFTEFKKSPAYKKIINKYYAQAPFYYPEFFPWN